MITIKVIDERSGEPLEDQTVALGLEGPPRVGIPDGERTDPRGEVHFERSPHDGTVFVNGRAEYRGHLSGRILVYVCETIPCEPDV